MTQFQILSANSSGMALQAARASGEAVTLETSDTSNPLQLWELQLQVANGYTGIALFNLFTLNSITFGGQVNRSIEPPSAPPLLMQPFSYGSTDEDAWYIGRGNNKGAVRFIYPPADTLTVEDWGGAYRSGDKIVVDNRGGENSLWTIKPAIPVPAA